MNTIVIILGILLLLGGIALTCLLTARTNSINRVNTANYRMHSGSDEQPPAVRKTPKWPMFLSLVGLIVFIVGNSFYVVPTGYTGVRTTFGLIDQESCMPGFNMVTPFVQSISLVNNKQQDLRFDDRVWAETKEQTVVYMEGVQVTYQIVPESSAWIYANVENWVEELVDADLTASALKSAARTLDAGTVTDRATIQSLSRDTLQTAVDEKYGENRVTIKNIVINNMDFEDSYNAAIAQKSQAIQEQQEQAIRNQTNIDKAEAEAEAARARAQGEADAELILAEGKAAANKAIAQSITDMTQLQDLIEKWDGKLPLYTGTDNSLFGILTNGTDTPSGDTTE